MYRSKKYKNRAIVDMALQLFILIFVLSMQDNIISFIHAISAKMELAHRCWSSIGAINCHIYGFGKIATIYEFLFKFRHLGLIGCYLFSQIKSTC